MKIKKIIVMGKARGRLIAVGLQSELLEEIICNPLSKQKQPSKTDVDTVFAQIATFVI